MIGRITQHQILHLRLVEGSLSAQFMVHLLTAAGSKAAARTQIELVVEALDLAPVLQSCRLLTQGKLTDSEEHHEVLDAVKAQTAGGFNPCSSLQSS